MLILGIKLESVWKKASISTVTVLDIITATSPCGTSESSCISKANPSGFLGFVTLPRYSILIAQPIPDGTNLTPNHPLPCLIAPSERCQKFVAFSLGIYRGGAFFFLMHVSSIWFTCLLNCICEKTLLSILAKTGIVI